MKERIKEFRKSLGLTQADFGAKIGLTQNYIAQLEMGRRDPSDRSIADMVREFNLNEEWLRSGSGDMFMTMDAADELAAYLGKVANLPEDDPRYKIIMAMSRIPEQYWGTIREIMDIIATDPGK